MNLQAAWESMTWSEFIQALSAYREHEYIRGRGERAYLEVSSQLSGISILDKASSTAVVVEFLNKWHCRFSPRPAAATIAEWIKMHRAELEKISDLDLRDIRTVAILPSLTDLHNSLYDLRNAAPGHGIPNMGVACASKILHLILPSLSVMWDNKIRPDRGAYGDFIYLMHRLAIKLAKELAPPEGRPCIEEYLQMVLDYPIRKPLAKFIDEYNWFIAWETNTP